MHSRNLWQEAHSIKEKEAPMRLSVTKQQQHSRNVLWNTDHEVTYAGKLERVIWTTKRNKTKQKTSQHRDIVAQVVKKRVNENL